jgi:hypothetical protein
VAGPRSGRGGPWEPGSPNTHSGSQPPDRLTAEERASRARQRARRRYSLEHPRPLVVERELAGALALFDTYFDDVTFAISGRPIVDWWAIPITRPDDPRYDEPLTVARATRSIGTASYRAPRDAKCGTRSTRYVKALIKGAYDDVVNAEVGSRNNTLTRSAFRFGQVVGAGLLEERLAVAALEEAAELCALPEGEARSTIRSGLRAGARHPLETR